MGGQRTDDAKSRGRGDGGDGRSPGGGRRREDGGRKDGERDGSGREMVVDDGGGGGDSRSRSRDRDRDRNGGGGGRKRRGDDDDGDSRDSDGGTGTDRVTEAKGGRGTARGSRSRDRDGKGDDDGGGGSLDRRKERRDRANDGDRGDDGRTTTRRSRGRSRSRDRHGDSDRGAKAGGSRRRQHGSRRSRTRDRRGGDGDHEDRRGGGGGGSRHRRRKRGSDRDDGRRRSSSRRRDGSKKKRRRRRSSSSSSSTSYSSSSSSGSGSSSSSGSGSTSSSSTSSSSDGRSKRRRRKHGVASKKGSGTKRKKGVEVVANERLLSKLASRGETLEEREERRARRRAERIASRFGYTPEDNPFNDPNLHETFSWKKKEAATAAAAAAPAAAGGGQRRQPPKRKGRKEEQEHILSEIDKVRKRRADREAQQDEMERLRAEESRLRELENYDEWAAKEEEFHLQQQRQRSAIRLLEKREKPVDVLAKNLLLFGLTEEEKTNRAKVKYQERYDALAELDTLEAELVEPHELLKDLKLLELQELLGDIEAYRDLEREAAAAAAKDGSEHDHAASEMIIQYWDNLHLVTRDEIRYVQTGGKGGAHSAVVDDIQQLFEDKSAEALQKMKEEVVSKLNSNETGVDTEYWGSVLSQLDVHRAKEELSDTHNMMLARQLEKLEKRKEALSKLATEGDEGEPGGGTEAARAEEKQEAQQNAALQTLLPSNVRDVNFGNLEESLGLSSEVNLGAASYAWQDKYRPRKPRYFNRVKTGYDWNKYNQTHYDHDNPPPKIVQGYKFNVFYPDLIDKTRTPEYKLEPADTDEFCILRFRAGPPYEDVAFKIINREWNRSRKRGFRCTFERGVLSLYFNFKSHWYRR